MEKIKWPDFFIIGTPKGGTTSLYQQLKIQDDIFLPEEKELRYFISQGRKKDKKAYLKNFIEAEENSLLGEASPSYFSSPIAIKKIMKINTEAKFIVSLRDPVDRLISHLLMYNRNHGIKQHLNPQIEAMLNEEFNQFIDEGFYAKHLERLLKHVEKERIKILIFEHWIKDQSRTIQDLLNFLGSKKPLVQLKGKSLNKYQEYKNPLIRRISTNSTVRSFARKIMSSEKRLEVKAKLSKEVKKPMIDQELTLRLRNLYREDKNKLEQLIQRNTNWK